MAGDEGRARAQIEARCLQRPKRGDRNRHQRRLGVGGQRQLVLGAVPDGVAQALAERLVHFLEDAAAFGKGVGELSAHTDGLATLSGEH